MKTVFAAIIVAGLPLAMLTAAMPADPPVVIVLGEHAQLRRGELMSAVQRANDHATTRYPFLP